MIKISQIKLLAEEVCKVAPEMEQKHGILGEAEKKLVERAAGKLLQRNQEEFQDFQILKRSIDARKKEEIYYVYQVLLSVVGEKKLLQGKLGKKGIISKYPGKFDGNMRLQKSPNFPNSPVVVGMGPAGLFAALTLAEHGVAPVVLERGADVGTRQRKVSHFWNTGELDPETNVQFGEGGAGTFSDGKLNTLVKDPTGYGRRVLETFVRYGAPEEILYLQKPHIGTDRLRSVVQAIRQRILELGGEVHFETKFEKAIWSRGSLQEILVNEKGEGRRIPCDHLVLATGHSARDTVTTLYEDGLKMEAKAFAMGVRVEHPQVLIGRNQYGSLFERLPAADYKLTYQTSAARGVYSFCMCPGGYVVNSSSEPGHLVVNGMSYYDRDGVNANSAIVVTVSPEDYGGESPLAGIAFQRKWEKAAFEAGGGQIPVQLLGDFCMEQKSTALGRISPCIKGGYVLSDVRKALPGFVGEAIAEGMAAFDQKIKGFAAEDVVLAGVESRTSSPVRICRDDSLQANIRGIYPCGEGAGYAGGITSSAMDGIRIAERILT